MSVPPSCRLAHRLRDQRLRHSHGVPMQRSPADSSRHSSTRMAVDIGGTFTDVVLLDDLGQLHTAKVPTTPEDPSLGVLNGAGRLSQHGLGGLDAFVHGTTLVLNALLERSGGRTGLITTRGFRDVLEIMRTNRPDMYNLQQQKPEPLVPRASRLEVDERLDSRGRVLRPLQPDDVIAAALALVSQGVESIAICFLFSYLNPAHEELARSAILERFPELLVSISSEVSREWREFERTSTVTINAYARPLMSRYADGLRSSLAGRGYSREVLFMQSNGGLLGAEEVKRTPVKTILSGPVGGVMAAEMVGRLTGRRQLLTLDIGGTSADMGLIDSGRAGLVAEKQVEGWPVQFAAVDVTAIGTGGGSVASVDPAGALQVGPRSAGAQPGPACYGRGGVEPTVTDALLVLGILSPDYFLGGELALDRAAASAAVLDRVARPLGLSLHEAAGGIVQIANARMLQALREVTLNRGYDVRDFTLLPYGGAGPLHATALARELGCAGVIVPVHPGVFSALGMLTADLKYDLARTCLQPLMASDVAALGATLREMEQEGRAHLAGLGGEASARRSADLRYRGQEYALSVPLRDGKVDKSDLAREFEEMHGSFYGYTLPDEVWLVSLRTVVTASLPAPRPGQLRSASGDALKDQRRIYLPEDRRWVEAPVYDRQQLGAGARLVGPAVVEEPQSTTLLLPGDVATVDGYGNLLIDLGGIVG